MRIRLKLKNPYTWPSRNPDKPNVGQITFIQTNESLPDIGHIIEFRDLKPFIEGGDLNENHYKYYENKYYVRVAGDKVMFNDAFFEECEAKPILVKAPPMIYP